MVVSVVQSAIIDGPANIRDKKTNQIIASINNEVFVPDLGRQGNWFDIEIICFSKLEDYGKSPQDSLPIWDKDGNLIGKLINYDTDSEPEVKDERWVYIWILGKTFKDNIVLETTLEARIQQLYNSKDQSIDAFKTSFSDWGNADCVSDFVPPDSLKHPNLKYWMVYSKTPLSWQVQAIFIFHKDNLIAVNSNRNLALPLKPVVVKNHSNQALYLIRATDLKNLIMGSIKYFYDFAG